MNVLTLTLEQIRVLTADDTGAYFSSDFATMFALLAGNIAKNPEHKVRFLQFCWMMRLRVEDMALVLEPLVRKAGPAELEIPCVLYPDCCSNIAKRELHTLRNRVFDSLVQDGGIPLYVCSEILQCEINQGTDGAVYAEPGTEDAVYRVRWSE